MKKVEERRGRPVGLALAACLLAVAFASAAHAEYPERNVRLVHGFAPGGAADTLSRVVAEALSARLGRPVVVEPRPGAGGVIGADAVAKAEPDGYVIGLVTGGHAVSAALSDKLPFDPVADFATVSTIVDYAFVIVGRGDVAAGGLRGVLAAAKARPGAVSYGSAGAGSTHHLTGELLGASAGVKLLHVPYRGDAAAMTGLLGDQIQLVVATSVAALPHVQAGAVRALAVTTAERWAGLPDVPTVAESGVEGFDVRTWAGLVAPRGTPAPVLARLRTALADALSRPEVKEKVEAVVAGTVRLRTPEEMKAMIESEIARWRKVASEAGVRAP